LLDGASLKNARGTFGGISMATIFKARLPQIREAETFKEVIPTRFAERYNRRPEDKELDS
jgi:hypothetical protein